MSINPPCNCHIPELLMSNSTENGKRFTINYGSSINNSAGVINTQFIQDFDIYPWWHFFPRKMFLPIMHFDGFNILFNLEEAQMFWLMTSMLMFSDTDGQSMKKAE